jgi:alkylated DNA repair protein (DNA oxidative demethylase)
VRLWPEQVDRGAQASLVAEILQLASIAPFYRPQMPGSGKDFSVEETNFGELGWVSDRSGYRYDNVHPVTGHVWPAMPPPLLGIWSALTDYPAAPQCCLVNLYRDGARMGLHQDRDEAARDAPVLSISLGDDAVFRIGGNSRRGPTKSIRLRSGDIVVFGGPARLAFHGIDRIIAGTSQLIPGGGRINLTLRRVTAA